MNVSPETFWNIEMKNRAMNQAQQQQTMDNIGAGIAGIAEAYAENKQLEAKASSYDDIGKILGTAMFSQNPDAMGALGNLQKEKDPRKKVMGYEQLFSLVGPMSNMMMAQGRLGVTQQGQQIQQNAPIRRAQVNAAAQAAAGQQRMTTLPPGINPDVIP